MVREIVKEGGLADRLTDRFGVGEANRVNIAIEAREGFADGGDSRLGLSRNHFLNRVAARGVI